MKKDTSLDGLFRPRSVAVVGASRQPGGIGHEVVRNLVMGGFQGPVYPVNPRAEVVHSIRCHPDLASIPGEVDLVVIVVPAPAVEGVMRQAAKIGARGAVIVSAGFRETGVDGRAREERVLSVARKAGIRVIGPNCMGILNTEPGVALNASFAAETPIPGRVAFVSQSGALGEAILSRAKSRELGLRMFASVGNRADVGAHDLLAYWEHDPEVRVILLYLESFGDPEAFRIVAERLRGKKPIVAIKSGRSLAGRRAAGSHTGSVSGEDRVVETFLRQCGVLRVQSMPELFDTAQALLSQPRPDGPEVAVVTNAGGPGILATDALVGTGLTLCEFQTKTRKRLEKILPPEASVQNPVDLIASADALRYRKALRAVVADPKVSSLLVLFVSPIMIDAAAVARAIVEETRAKSMPVVACLMGRLGEKEGMGILRAAGIPVFEFPEEAALTLSNLVRQSERAARKSGRRPRIRVDATRARRILAAAKVSEDGWIQTKSVFRLLEHYGIPMATTMQATTPRGAAQAARKLGYPVCLKALSSALVHKSEHGGVVTGITSEEEILEQAHRILTALKPQYPDIALEIQAMAPGHRELLLGFRRDESFGPVFAVGFGGVAVEVLRDVAVRVAPLFENEPKLMLDSLRGAPLLGAFRGAPPVDRRIVEQSLLRLARLADDLPRIRELEINPFIADRPGGRTLGVDARARINLEQQ